MSSLVHVLLAASGMYLLAGLLFAIPFALFGADRIHPAARGSGWGFRCIIVPGVMVFWPWLVWKWLSGRESEEDNAHRRLARKREVAR